MKNFSHRQTGASKRAHALAGTPQARQGFALIMSLVLMGFIVLLLYSLAAMTQIETQASTSNQRMLQAQQNALTGLNIALGQLQKYAGPDQRVTALANMDETLADTTTANGHWLGVYGNAAPIDYGQTPSSLATAITGNSNGKGSQAVLLNWLVSGNEGTTFDPAADVDDDGHIVNAPGGWSFTPSSAVNLAQASVLPGSGDDQALLVGENSVTDTTDYVAAPLVSVSGSNGGTEGRYAWWIGDEGTKASVSLPMAGNNQLAAAFVSSQRNAIELVNKVAGDTYSTANLIGTNYDPASGTLTKLNSLDDLPMVAQDAASMSTAVKHRFHDLTPYSYSLLTDTYAGGLKQDLSAVLATGATSPADSDTIFAAESLSSGDLFGVPTWGALRSFAQTTASTGGLDPRLPTRTDVGIAPVLSYFSLGLQYAAPNGAAPGEPIQVAMFPLVVLWNPYTTTIKAHEYEVGIMAYNRGEYQLQVEDDTKVYNDSKDPGKDGWAVKETVDFNRGGKLAGTGDAYSYVRFKVDCPAIPPGQSLIFTLQDSEIGKDYKADKDQEPQNTLTNGLDTYGHVLLNNGAVFDSDDFEPAGTDGEGNPVLQQKRFRVTGAHLIIDRDNKNGYDSGAFSLSGGELNAYLGEVRDSASRNVVTDDSNDKQWYQLITRISPAVDGNYNIFNNRNEYFQQPAQLGGVYQPTSSLFIMRNFGESLQTKTYPDVRWLAQSNPRSLYTLRTISKNPTNISAGGGMDSIVDQFTRNTDGLRASAGPNLDSGSSIVDATLFEFRPSDQPLLSLGQLQHANLSYVNTYPAYPIGNSLGDFHFRDSRGQLLRNLSETLAPSNLMDSYYDISWLLNRALWDQYFVSTVPHAGTGTSTDTDSTAIPSPLPNPRIVRTDTATDEDLRNASLAAGELKLEGGFNVNSTSEQAWRAVLGGINQLPYDPENQSSSGNTLAAALSRFSKPTGEPAVDTDQAWAWKGYRQLTEEQIAELAHNIVTEIRARGPFVSMADFINRRLVDNPNTAEDERFKGALQAAIDATPSGTGAANSGEDTAYGYSGSNPFHMDEVPNYSNVSDVYDAELMQGYSGSFDANVPTGSLSAFAPQFLTQADILSAIGAGLSARSDTFRIRSYGEVTDPFTGEPLARAWCEAIVQREPEYADPSGNAPEDTLTALNAANKSFGRKFKIVAFQWLSSEEI